MPTDQAPVGSQHSRVSADRVAELVAIEEWLGAAAAELSDTPPPVDLVSMCRRLGIGLRIETAGGRRHRGAITRGADKTWITVYRTGRVAACLSGGDRFTVAHEIAHHLIDERFGFVPRRRAEYWRCEEVCNSFAQRLLAPPDAVSVDETRDARDLARLIGSNAERLRVSTQVAARALVPRLPTPVAVGGLLLSPHGSTGRIGFRTWWVENRNWAGQQRAPRIAVYDESLLGPVVSTLAQLRPSKGISPPLALDGAESAYLYRRGASPWGSLAVILSAAFGATSSDRACRTPLANAV